MRHDDRPHQGDKASMIRQWYSQLTSSERSASLFLFCLTIGIYALAFSAMLALCLANGRDPISTVIIGVKDPTGFAILARNLLAYGAFTDAPPPPYVPTVFRTPGYPVFLAGVLFLGRTPYAVPLVQIVLVAFTAVLIFRLGKRLFSHGVGLVAAILYVLDPVAMLLSLQFMSETLFMFLFVLFLFVLFSKVEQPVSPRTLFLAGILLGGATLVRPIVQYLPPVVLVYVFLTQRKRWRGASLYRDLGAFSLGVILIIGPWMIRNGILAGGYHLSTIGPVTIARYYIPEYLAVKQNVPFELAKARYLKSLESVLPDSNPSPMEVSRRYMAAYREIIREDVSGYLRFHLVRTLRFFTLSSWKIPFIYYWSYIREDPLPPAVNYSNVFFRGSAGNVIEVLLQRPSEWLFGLDRLAHVLIFALSGLPLWFERGERRIMALFLFGITFYFALLYGPLGQPRYWLSAEPSMLLLALWGVEHLRRMRRARVGI